MLSLPFQLHAPQLRSAFLHSDLEQLSDYNLFIKASRVNPVGTSPVITVDYQGTKSSNVNFDKGGTGTGTAWDLLLITVFALFFSVC